MEPGNDRTGFQNQSPVIYGRTAEVIGDWGMEHVVYLQIGLLHSMNGSYDIRVVFIVVVIQDELLR
jgi:hypothetical protein